jgi:hypothetical protein
MGTGTIRNWIAEARAQYRAAQAGSCTPPGAEKKADSFGDVDSGSCMIDRSGDGTAASMPHTVNLTARTA